MNVGAKELERSEYVTIFVDFLTIINTLTCRTL